MASPQLSVSLVFAGIAVGLLVIYGADIAVGLSLDSGEGFITLDHKTRGMLLGVPALILPFVAYFISRKEPSKTLGAMITAAGILIIVGGVVVIGNSEPAEAEATARNAMSESVMLIIPGAVQIILGIFKIIKS